MRQKRAKAYRKLMSLYSLSFGFRQPYQILIDSEMCKIAVQSNVELVKQFGNVLQGTVKPMITQCCIHELYLQGKSVQPAVDLAKTFERRKCNHREAIPGDECLTSVIGDTNKHRYVIATQSQPLRTSLRKIPAVPVIHINRSVIVLEPPSDVTLKTKYETDERALHPSQSELAQLPSMTLPEPPKRKKKVPKGPNPLSVKKKKSSADVHSSAKDKGKEKSSRSSAAGFKRKLDAKDEDAESKLQSTVVTAEGAEATEGHGGHKRKRRRKLSDKTSEDG